MLEVRRLGPADWTDMLMLRFTRPTHAGEQLETFTTNPLIQVSPKYQADPHLAIGAFDNGKLVSYICCHVGEDYWVLDLMISDTKPQNLRVCLQACLKELEARGIYKFYYAFPKKWARAYRSFWKDGSEALRKYVITDIAEVVPYKIPTNKWVWENVLYKVIVPANLLIRESNAESTRT
jgi:hypothetical protein